MTSDRLLTAAHYASQLQANGHDAVIAQCLSICESVPAPKAVGALTRHRRDSTKKHAKQQYIAELKQQRKNKNTAVGSLGILVWWWVLSTLASKVFELWWNGRVAAQENAGV